MRIPVVDVSCLAGSAATTELVAAARELGVFSVVGHGVPALLRDRLMKLTRRLFALPVERLAEVEHCRSPQFRGYSRVGGEHTGGRRDWREQFDVGLEWPQLTLGPGDAGYLRLIGPNQWPSALPQFAVRGPVVAGPRASGLSDGDAGAGSRIGQCPDYFDR